MCYCMERGRSEDEASGKSPLPILHWDGETDSDSDHSIPTTSPTPFDGLPPSSFPSQSAVPSRSPLVVGVPPRTASQPYASGTPNSMTLQVTLSRPSQCRQ